MKPVGFTEISALWRGKEAAHEVENIFQTFDWNKTWWDIYGQGKDLLLWSLGKAGEEGILPLYRSAAGKGLSALRGREVRFLGTGESLGTDYLDIISSRSTWSADLLVRWERAMADAGEDWDVLNLLDVRPDSRALAMCTEWHAASGNPIIVMPRYPCPCLELPSTIEEYRETVLSRTVRRAVANKWNRLRKDFRVEIRFTEEGGPADRLFEEFVALHQARWKGQDHGGKFSDPLYLGFHRVMAREAHARKALFIANMYLDGEPAAAQYGFLFGGRYYYWQAGRRLGLDRYSPGLVLFYKIIEELCARKVKGIDLLRGAHPYKLHFASRMVHTLQVRVYNRRRRRSLALYALDSVKCVLRRLRPQEAPAI